MPVSLPKPTSRLILISGLGCVALVYADNRSNFPYRGTYSTVYFGLEVTTLVLCCATCSLWVVVLLYMSLRQHLSYNHPEVWTSGVRDFDWFNHPSPADTPKEGNSFSTPVVWIIGESRGLCVRSGFIRPLRHFIFHHTPWRRVVGVEPIWLSAIRGTVGLTLLLGLSAYASIQCIKLPLEESSGSLPVRSRGDNGTTLVIVTLEGDIGALVSVAGFALFR